MRGLKISAASKDTIKMAVKKIDAAMLAFGIVQDISLEIDVNKGRYYISDSAELIILLNDEKNLPSIVTIDKATVTLTGKCVDAFCMYCKQPGHLLDKCPTRPGNKKHSHMAGEREVSKPTAPSAPPSKRNRRAKRQPHQASSAPTPPEAVQASSAPTPSGQSIATPPDTGATTLAKAKPAPPA
ncbi:hypothetical protein GGI22_001062, partial [Coemansia erecta]